MKILHVHAGHMRMPVAKYGGTERVLWALAEAQRAAGHSVRLLVRPGTAPPEHAQPLRPDRPIHTQVGDWPDIVHFHWPYTGELDKPFISTEHGNASGPRSYPINTVFLSRRHAANHGADCYVYNGLDWREYGDPGLSDAHRYCHFLGKAKAPAKNLHGAIAIARRGAMRLAVLGGRRINFSRNPYFYPDPRIAFYGMVGGEKKHSLLRGSSALLAPVRWHEPFGLAIIESLYLGAPVLATPYGALPELLEDPATGLLSDDYETLAAGLRDLGRFDRRACHEVARTRFGADSMARGYDAVYQRVLAGESLNRRAPQATESLQVLLPVKGG